MLVSIVINNYNYADFIAQAIESALVQTHPDVEVIVVDDGSRDHSMEVIHRYSDAVRVVAQANGGQGSAYNAGFQNSRGKLVLFLDADDWLYPEAAAELAAAWSAGVSKLQFRLDMVGRLGQPLGRQLPRDLHEGRIAHDLMRDFGTYGSPPGSGNAYDVDFLRQVLPLDPLRWRIGADSVPILLAPAFGGVVSVHRSLGAYRIHRDPDDGGLLYNNTVRGLAAECARIEAAKRMVLEGLDRAGVSPRRPLLLAPWEARIVTMARRFGETDLVVKLAGEPQSRTWFLLRSVWGWTVASVYRRVLISGWVLAVGFLPAPLALRVARLHRRASGIPVTV